ncbi:MAG: hypothetical protein AAF747_07455, partial [Planctomycetota bacterium]
IEGGQAVVGWDLDGDGLADISPPDQPTPDDRLLPNFQAVPFNGFGRVRIEFDPSMILPDGIMLPLTAEPVPASYQEGKL